jgi:RHS repeat-associated protein
MKTKLTLALVAIITGSAFAAIPAVLPEFKNEKQLAEWRAEMAAKNAATTTASEDHAFYTGKPYIDSTGSYAFKYRSYNPDLARWTSEDPSGYPDGANNQVFVPAPSFMFDPNGLAWLTYYQWSARSWKTVTQVIIETNTEIQLTGVSVGVGFNSNGPTGQLTFDFSISNQSVEISRSANTDLTFEYDDSPPSGNGWQKVGDYTKYEESTGTSRIENNKSLGDDRFRNIWHSYTEHTGYQKWQKWVE